MRTLKNTKEVSLRPIVTLRDPGDVTLSMLRALEDLVDYSPEGVTILTPIFVLPPELKALARSFGYFIPIFWDQSEKDSDLIKALKAAFLLASIQDDKETDYILQIPFGTILSRDYLRISRSALFEKYDLVGSSKTYVLSYFKKAGVLYSSPSYLVGSGRMIRTKVISKIAGSLPSLSRGFNMRTEAAILDAGYSLASLDGENPHVLQLKAKGHVWEFELYERLVLSAYPIKVNEELFYRFPALPQDLIK